MCTPWPSRRAIRRRAFSLPSFFCLLLSILLLIVILLPTLQMARLKAKKALCLSNMKQVSLGSHAYAVEDDLEQLIPIHGRNVTTAHANGFHGPWSWRTAMPFVYGGRTAVKNMLTSGAPIYELTKHLRWGTPTRPLNRYLYGDVDKAHYDNLPLYHCPSDSGYPKVDPATWPTDQLDAPPECAQIPCYDFLGNSYRVTTCGMVWTPGGNSPVLRGAFSTGVEGHAASSIENPARTTLYCEPMFSWWTRQQQAKATSQPHKRPAPGWHGEIESDNVAYCDGSVRTTKIGPLLEWSPEKLDTMGIAKEVRDTPNLFLRRGRTWQVDTYPTPGAFIRVFKDGGEPLLPSDSLKGKTGWPFDNHTRNLPPG